MTSYKLCLTFLVVVSVSISVTANTLYDTSKDRRVRRSVDENDQSTAESTTEDADNHGFQAGYRFGEEFFLPEASKSIPAEYKKKADGCQRVVKNSMVCMVCKDPKTNAKYEQCSYVGNPPPKQSSARDTTEKKQVPYIPESSSESSESSTLPRGTSENYETSTSPRGSSNYDFSPSPRDTSNYESSTSPRGSEESYESSTPSRSPYETYEASKPEETRFTYKPYASAPYSYSTSSKEETDSSEDPAESSDCRQIVKDSETCKICKDPKTGKDFERCSSSYQPDDKTYAYGKTEKYGYPESHEDERSDYKSYESKPDYTSYENKSDDKSESSEDQAETAECRQVKKNDQSCTICKDPKTGRDTERCSSSFRPADKTYAYGTTERFGGPSSHDKNDYKSHNDNDDEDKSTDATYDSPSEYHSSYPKSNDDSYSKYESELPEEYRQSNYNSGSGYLGSSPSYGGSSEAEYAAPSVPAVSTKTSGNGEAEGCHDVKKDSMTCTICTDPKTGGNFEKCSYAYQPDDKVYKFTKSKTFGYPKNGEGNKGLEGEKGSQGLGDFERQSESKQVLEAVDANPCKQVQKNSMICTVCKDPKTGASSEQCAYGAIPSEKLFSYIASKSFENPDKENALRGKQSNKEGEEESRQVPKWSDEELGQFVAESKQVDDAIKTNPCRKIDKDTMTCTICKDPKTGGTSEECSYSSKPKENHYIYSKSKSSGSPKKDREVRDNENYDELQEPRDTKQVVDAVEASSPCRKIEKDSMTCTICKDPKTGENSEQCAYSYKPKERHFTYTKSKSFGNPRKDGETGGKGTKEEKPEESHQISRWTSDGQNYYAKDIRPRGFSKPDWTYGE